MRPSQLQLDHYYFEEFNFSVNDDYAFEPGMEEPKLLAEDLEVNVQPARHSDDPLLWMFKLHIRLENKDKRFPYTFSIRVTGFFEIGKDCPSQLADQLALVNAPSILYASARELMAVVSGRSRILSIFLPTVSFFEPPKETKTEAITPSLEGKRKGERTEQGKSRKRSGGKRASPKK